MHINKVILLMNGAKYRYNISDNDLDILRRALLDPSPVHKCVSVLHHSGSKGTYIKDKIVDINVDLLNAIEMRYIKQ